MGSFFVSATVVAGSLCVLWTTIEVTRLVWRGNRSRVRAWDSKGREIPVEAL